MPTKEFRIYSDRMEGAALELWTTDLLKDKMEMAQGHVECGH